MQESLSIRFYRLNIKYLRDVFLGLWRFWLAQSILMQKIFILWNYRKKNNLNKE